MFVQQQQMRALCAASLFFVLSRPAEAQYPPYAPPPACQPVLLPPPLPLCPYLAPTFYPPAATYPAPSVPYLSQAPSFSPAPPCMPGQVSLSCPVPCDCRCSTSYFNRESPHRVTFRTPPRTKLYIVAQTRREWLSERCEDWGSPLAPADEFGTLFFKDLGSGAFGVCVLFEDGTHFKAPLEGITASTTIRITLSASSPDNSTQNLRVAQVWQSAGT
jgi:hypothetical protein